MPARSPSERETERLHSLLDAYDRDELWLRVRSYYHLAEQPDQISIEVVDASGQGLSDRGGRRLLHTLQVVPPVVAAGPGQLLVVRRAGQDVWVDTWLPATAPDQDVLTTC